MDNNVSTWATAISTHAGNGRKIFWRFAKDFSPAFVHESLPDRIILAWRYESENGQPITEEHQQMDHLEDLLEPITDSGNFATLALVSTGEGLREWTYYAKSEEEFVERLNLALFGEMSFPIEIHVAHDRTWSMYREFKSGLRDKST